MWKVVSLLNYLNPYSWMGSRREILPPPKIRKLDPLDYKKNPELIILNDLGASVSIRRECQKLIECFKEKGLNDRLPELMEAYKKLIKTNGCTDKHISFFNLAVYSGIKNKYDVDMNIMLDHIVEQIDRGMSFEELYAQHVPKPGVNGFS